MNFLPKKENMTNFLVYWFVPSVFFISFAETYSAGIVTGIPGVTVGHFELVVFSLFFAFTMKFFILFFKKEFYLNSKDAYRKILQNKENS